MWRARSRDVKTSNLSSSAKTGYQGHEVSKAITEVVVPKQATKDTVFKPTTEIVVPEPLTEVLVPKQAKWDRNHQPNDVPKHKKPYSVIETVNLLLC